MSRSKRKTPIVGNSMKESEKAFKRQEHQRERAAVRSSEDIEEVDTKAFGNPWAGPKDGKHWLRNVGREYFAKLMRK